MLEPLTLWIITNCGKLLKRWEYQTILPVSWETSIQVKKQKLEPYMEQLTGLKLREEYDKAVYCHPVYLTYMQRSYQISCSVMSDSLWPHESQHARPPYPSPSLRVHSNSRPSGQWYDPAISSSVIPFSSYPQSLPASEYFPVSQLFTWGGQSTGVSALASFLPKKSQGWSPSKWTGFGSPCSPRDSQESSPTPQFKSINSSGLSFLHSPTLASIHDQWKNRSLD